MAHPSHTLRAKILIPIAMPGYIQIDARLILVQDKVSE
jgi:hypothetical protein